MEQVKNVVNIADYQNTWDKLKIKLRDHHDYHEGNFESILISYDPDGYFQLSCTESACAKTLKNILTEAIFLIDVETENKKGSTGQ